MIVLVSESFLSKGRAVCTLLLFSASYSTCNKINNITHRAHELMAHSKPESLTSSMKILSPLPDASHLNLRRMVLMDDASKS